MRRLSAHRRQKYESSYKHNYVAIINRELFTGNSITLLLNFCSYQYREYICLEIWRSGPEMRERKQNTRSCEMRPW